MPRECRVIQHHAEPTSVILAASASHSQTEGRLGFPSTESDKRPELSQPSFTHIHPHVLPARLLRAEEGNRTQPINYTILEFSSIFKRLRLFLSKQTQERRYITKQERKMNHPGTDRDDINTTTAEPLESKMVLKQQDENRKHHGGC